ncbi:MAG: SOUL-domain-containing protein [Monoraphidium minutum]|nr:MAG: SOUL-domain-containing protein [Monoraphidium minutum]
MRPSWSRYAAAAGCLLLALAGASAARPLDAAGGGGSNPAEAPWFCHDLECPKYKVVENMTDIGIEHRQYPVAKWVTTVVEGKSYDSAVAAGFWRLFKYISGNNKDAAKVDMTAPVTVKVKPGQGPACKDEFTISFFIPFEHQASPPQPSDDAVVIESRPALDVYVAAFGGWAKGSTYLQHAADAGDALEDKGLKIDSGFFYTAGYDSPFRLTNRHNEVWLPVAGDAAAGVAES